MKRVFRSQMDETCILKRQFDRTVALKVGDIDSGRMTLRIEQGKGRKDRYAMLPPVLLERLRTWWRVARAQGKVLSNSPGA